MLGIEAQWENGVSLLNGPSNSLTNIFPFDAVYLCKWKSSWTELRSLRHGTKRFSHILRSYHMSSGVAEKHQEILRIAGVCLGFKPGTFQLQIKCEVFTRSMTSWTLVLFVMPVWYTEYLTASHRMYPFIDCYVYFVFGMFWVRILDRRPIIVTNFLRGFPQYIRMPSTLPFLPFPIHHWNLSYKETLFNARSWESVV
jgi:hypothetical protein